jgi:hypothetical protein
MVRAIAGRLQRTLGKGAERTLLVALATLAVATLVLLIWEMGSRIPGYAESFCLFNSRRVHDGHPLFVDPLVGAHEYGLPPSRWYVGYSAVVAQVLGRLPQSLFWSRGLSLTLWTVTVALVLVASPSFSKNVQRSGLSLPSATALAVALAFLGAYRVMLHTASARPDALALLLAALGFVRACRCDKLDVLSGALFAAAFVTKPNVISLGLACVVIDLSRRNWRALGLAAVGALACVAVPVLATQGSWLTHLTPALGLRAESQYFLNPFLNTGPFVFAPLAIAYSARGARRPQTALIVAVTVTLAGFLKPGAESNYWLEPCLAAICVAKSADAPALRWWHAPLLAFHVCWNAPVAIREWWMEDVGREATTRAFRRARSSCGDGFILAPDLGAEWTLNGRIHTIPLEMALRGEPAFVARWADDARVATCIVDYAWPPRQTSVTSFPIAYPAPVQAAIEQRFEYVWSEGGISLFHARPTPRTLEPSR